MRKHYNWKGNKNVPENIKIHWIDPEKNLLPRGLLNNSNKRLNPNAQNYTPKTIIARNPHFNKYNGMTFKKRLNLNAKNIGSKVIINPRRKNMTLKNKNKN